MTDNQLPPDVIGHLAGVTGTQEPLAACNSCLRGILYGTLAHLASALSYQEDGYLGRLKATGHMQAAMRILTDLVKVDLIAQYPQAEDMPDADWALAISSFYEARVEHYCDMETGEVKFEPHDDEGDILGAGL
ncbi:hypothetical protein ACFOOK_26090 [Micromonospora krabiensis]|uniref:Uncharacterized protein n=1 Tax=Micromonospora krabiensis TaxID=307121 RepID=A0A1C3N5X8_9ACTN|nr:hypothetical protein [Micromonospora krabiensis]SBV27963.1 hypothetical protein GA0070620_3494 [Micromonospora krabiensis]